MFSHAQRCMKATLLGGGGSTSAAWGVSRPPRAVPCLVTFLSVALFACSAVLYASGAAPVAPEPASVAVEAEVATQAPAIDAVRTETEVTTGQERSAQVDGAPNSPVQVLEAEGSPVARHARAVMSRARSKVQAAMKQAQEHPRILAAVALAVILAAATAPLLKLKQGAKPSGIRKFVFSSWCQAGGGH
ncbi:hypothetical protein CSUI_009806 [Cystoisospora suis]|uniref:Transmembrane protein n=1 Tax=Cystoisospora suis TaxID=483139 RepID=A0A2C6KIQ5_9APIC|nr:hypothetical protein CSUI_009806 [Cystoisospora suis]